MNVSVAFGPGGTVAIDGYDNGDVYLRDTATGKKTATHPVKRPRRQGRAAREHAGVQPGRRTLAVGANSDVYLWPVKS